MAEETKTKAEKNEVRQAVVREVPTQLERYAELEDGTIMDELALLVTIYNQQKEILRRI